MIEDIIRTVVPVSRWLGLLIRMVRGPCAALMPSRLQARPLSAPLLFFQKPV